MRLLTVLTLIYAAVLVLAVAASLVLIWVYLRKIGAVLGQVRTELAEVANGASGLERLLEPPSKAPEGIANALAETSHALSGAAERLNALFERAGARQFR